jgi:4'-phosphopantetheinyl transferase
MGADIAVWLAGLDGASGRGALSQSEAESADRMRGSHRSRYENAHRALRVVLSAHTGIPPRDLGFERYCAACGSREHGKPRLVTAKHGRPPSFSLARNKSFAAIAVCADGEIGVDLEDREEALPATYSWCHPNEKLQLSSLPPGRAKAAALRVWVRREAILKAMGLGLGDRTQDLDLSGMPLRLGGWATVSQGWHLTDLDNPDRLIISVAAAEPGKVTIRRLDHRPCPGPSLESPRVERDVSKFGC